MNRLPKSHLLAGRIFDRRKFLDGSAKVYFGPGQGPGVVNTYTPPTDWNPAGGLLQMPEVVWLLLSVGGTTLPSDNNIIYQSFITQTFEEQDSAAAEGYETPQDGDVVLYSIGTFPADYTTQIQYYNGVSPPGLVVTGNTFSNLILQQFYPDTYDTAYEVCAKAADAIDPTITQNHPSQDHTFWVYYPGFAKAYFDAQDTTRDLVLTYYIKGLVHTSAVAVNVSDIGKAESLRLASVYQQVKTKIESIRAGKTFVQILNYSSIAKDETGTSINPYYPDLGPNNNSIYLLPLFNDDPNTFVAGNLFAVVCTDSGSGYMQYALPDFEKTIAKFNDFGLRIYQAGVYYPDYSKYTGVNKKPVTDILGFFSDATYELPTERARSYLLSVWNGFNADIQLVPQTINAQIVDYSDKMTVDSLVQQIADFYKFDPTTGK